LLVLLGERRGMKQRTGNRCRRRCCECRHWFTPAPSAAKTQLTCGKQCRLRRRAAHERARRQLDLTASREADRARQREHRERVRAEKPERRPLSQAGLSAQVAAAIGEILDDLGQAQRLSQAGLRGRLKRLAQLACGEIASAPSKTGTRKPDVTGRPQRESHCGSKVRCPNRETLSQAGLATDRRCGAPCSACPAR
jgi:hypothetical protein